MKINEIIIKEVPVISSWIANITRVKGPSRNITMTLGNGKKYSVKNVDNRVYRNWIRAPSKGQFWHQNIKNNYDIERIL